MIIEHIPIDIESFTSDVIASLQRESELKSLRSLMEVSDLSELKSAIVFVTVVSVFFDGINKDTPEDHSILHNSVVRILAELALNCFFVQIRSNDYLCAMNSKNRFYGK